MTEQSFPQCIGLDGKIDRLAEDMTEVKKDLKSMAVAINKMAVVEEKIASLLKMSEHNGKSIDELWKRVDVLREDNSTLRENLAKTNGLSGNNSRVLDRIVHVVLTVMVGIVIWLLTTKGS